MKKETSKAFDRHMHVASAGLKISKAIIDVSEEYKLTYAEVVSILTQDLQSLTKYVLRDERGEE